MVPRSVEDKLEKEKIMAKSLFTMRQLLEAGVHFGHRARRWNPKMRSYIFGVRNGIHILDLQQTVPALTEALSVLRSTAARGGKVLFVGTKRQAQEKVADAAMRSGQFYVNHRWLGGMLTNWKTISKSITRLKELEDILADGSSTRSKKELLMLNREREKLDLAIGGIRNMGGAPDVVFIVDTNKEDIAIKEARTLNIPVIAIIDSNSNPDGITYPIPGNDDAIRAIDLYCNLAVSSILDGVKEQLGKTNVDIGEAENVDVKLPASEKSPKKQKAPAAVDVKLPKETPTEEKAAEPSEAPASEDVPATTVEETKKAANA